MGIYYLHGRAARQDNIHGGGRNPLVTNPGLAKTIQSFAGAINFKDYPKFTLVTQPSEFILGEILLVNRDGSGFNNVGLIHYLVMLKLIFSLLFLQVYPVISFS